MAAIAIGPLGSVPFLGLPAELGQARSVAWLQDSSWRGRAHSVLLGCGLFFGLTSAGIAGLLLPDPICGDLVVGFLLLF